MTERETSNFIQNPERAHQLNHFSCLLVFLLCTQNSVCQCTLMDITHNGYMKIDGVDFSGVKDKAANVAEREKAD